MPSLPDPDLLYQPPNPNFNTAYQRFHQSLHPTEYRHEGPSIDKEIEDLRRGFEALQRSFYRISQGMAFVRQQVNDSLAVVDVGVEGVATDVHHARSAITSVTHKFPTRNDYLLVLLLIDLAIWVFAGYLLYKIWRAMREGQTRCAGGGSGGSDVGEQPLVEELEEEDSEWEARDGGGCWPERVQLLLSDGKETGGGLPVATVRRGPGGVDDSEEVEWSRPPSQRGILKKGGVSNEQRATETVRLREAEDC